MSFVAQLLFALISSSCFIAIKIPYPGTSSTSLACKYMWVEQNLMCVHTCILVKAIIVTLYPHTLM